MVDPTSTRSVDLDLRLKIPRRSDVRFQLQEIALVEIRVLDSQSLTELTELVSIDPRTSGDRTITIQDVPVGLRILRIEGFGDPPNIDQASGLPFAEEGFALDLFLNVRPGETTRAEVSINDSGITGSVADRANEVPDAGQVEQVADLFGAAETQPDVDLFALQGAITFRRGLDSSDIFLEAFRTDSVDFIGPTTDLDGQSQGMRVNDAGAANRQNPSVAMDQLGNFSVVWEENGNRIQGRSFDEMASPIAEEESDLSLSATGSFESKRVILGSTTNPDPPPGEGFGGETRHMLYLNTSGSDTSLGYKTFEADNMDCDPLIDCPPDAALVDCPCLILDNMFFESQSPPTLNDDSNIALGVSSDGFLDLVAFEDSSDVWFFVTRPWVGFNAIELIKVNPVPGKPGRVDIAVLGFNFSLGEDNYAICYEMDGKVFCQSFKSSSGKTVPVSALVEIANGSQVSISPANLEQFYLCWVSPEGEVLMELRDFNTLESLSDNPPHRVSDKLVLPGTSRAPKIAAGSFGAVVVWEGQAPDGQSGVFQKRFNVGFRP